MAARSHHESKNIKEEKANVICAVWPFPSDYCVLRAYWVRLVWLYSLHPTKKTQKKTSQSEGHTIGDNPRQCCVDTIHSMKRAKLRRRHLPFSS